MTAYDTAALAVPNILRYWALADTSGSSAVESVAAAHGTYFNSPTLNVTPGPIQGQAGVQLTLASSHYVTMPFSGLTTEVSIFGWVMPITAGSLFYRDGTTSGGTGWIISNSASFPLFRTNGNDSPTATTDSNFYIPAWVDGWQNTQKRTFFVQTSDGTTAKFYFDGELVAEAPGAAASNMVSPMVLGRNSVSGTPYYSGTWAGFGLVSRAITAEEIRTLYKAGRRPQISRPVRGSGVVSTGTSNTPANVTNSRPGDRIAYLLAAKPDTLSAPSANNGYTVARATSGGTGTQAADTGAMTLWIIAKDATVWNEPPPTISWTGTASVAASHPFILRPERGYQWADAITTSATWITVASDTNTASPLTGTVGTLANNPTEGDAFVVVGAVPSDSGNGVVTSASVTATGLTSIADTQYAIYGGTVTGNDLGHASAVHYIMTGTASTDPTVSIVATSLTNHSGAIALLHLRQTPITGSVWSDPGQEADTALPGTTTVEPAHGTKFYLASTGSPGVTPSTYGSVWNDTANITALPMPHNTPSNTSLSTLTVTRNLNTADYDVAIGAFVSEPLSAQTISGMFNLNIGVAENSTNLNGFTQVVVRLIQPDGSERSVLYAGNPVTASTGVTGDNSREWPVSTTVFTTRRFVASLTSQTATAGDRLVVEIGYRSDSNTTSYIQTLRTGDPTAGSDVSWADDQATTADRTWIAFQQELFVITGTGSLSLSGSGTHSSVATASLDLSGSGTWTTTSSASLDLSGSGSATSPSSASASLSLTATGDAGVASSAASGTASLDLSAVGSGQVSDSGTASLDLSASANILVGTALLSLDASGTGGASGIATASLSLDATGNAGVARSGTAAIGLSATGAALAASARTGTALLSFSATGVSPAYRTATGLLSFSATGGAGVGRSGTASISLFRSTGGVGVGRTGTASIAFSGIAVFASRSGTASLTLTMPPLSIVAPGLITTQGVGEISLVDEELIFAPDMSLTLETSTLDRAPSALRVILTGGQAQTDVVFDIDGTDVLTVSTNSEGSLSQTQINVNTTLGTAGVHTLTATQVATTGTITASVDFTVLYAPLVYPPPPTPNTPPVVVPDAISTVDNTQHWVLQDLLPEIDGGIGTYVFPHNPREMTSPHYEYAMSSTHSTASDGKIHIFQAGNMPKEWVFKGYCPTQAHQEAITAYRSLNRRFWIIDHRNRAWVVMFTDAQFVPHLRQNYNGVDTDWGSDFTVTAAVFAQDYSVPS